MQELLDGLMALGFILLLPSLIILIGFVGFALVGIFWWLPLGMLNDYLSGCVSEGDRLYPIQDLKDLWQAYFSWDKFLKRR